jgi:hypothetical protein
MNGDRFDAWLDAAMEPSERAPEGFADAVMARVAETPQLAPAIEALPATPHATPLPLWARVVLDPAVLGAVLLAALAAWKTPALFALVAAGQEMLSGGGAGFRLPPGTLETFSRPPVLMAIALSLGMLAAWAVWSLVSATASTFGIGSGPQRARPR